GDGGRRRAVVELVHAGGAHRERPGGDVRGGAGGGVGRVVGRVVAGQAEAREGDRLAGADVLRGEGDRAASQADAVADLLAVQGDRREGSVRASVVDLVVGGEAHGDRVLGDVRGGRGRR